MPTLTRGRHWLVPAALVFATLSLHASQPKFFRASTQTEFLLGEVENLSIDSRGQLVLGPATDLVYETPSPFLWTVSVAPDGALFMGTGNDGRVFRVDAQGKGAPFFDASELEIHAMAPGPNGGLYVASSPDGRIYKVERNGTATTFFDPGDKYIWALVTDARGNVYAGTGERGLVYKIAPDGTGNIFYDTKASHATALAVDRAGNILVGTESPGRVLRVDAAGKAFMLLDSPYQEIHTLKFDDKGNLYVGAVNGRGAAGGAPSVSIDSSNPAASDPNRAPVPSVSVSTEVTAIGGVETGGAGTSSTSRGEGRTSKGAVYRIAPDGLWDPIWESRDDSPYDLAFDAEGRLVIATGSKGKIFRLEGNPLRPMLLARAAAQQVTALHKDAAGRMYYATANPGKLFRLSPTRAATGTYESDVYDAQMVSSWGTMSWRGTPGTGGKIEVVTRSGNTQPPDDTWSPWSSPYATADGSAISSPKARFLQWRVVLAGAGDGPVLTSVSASYLQRNLRPEVQSITVHPPGIVFQKPFSTGDPDLAGFENQSTPDRRMSQAAQNQGGAASPSLGRRTYQRGLQTLVWRADDENGDDLLYEVLYRREGDAAWKNLRPDQTDQILVWDTSTVPNGTYVVKVVASDAPSNGDGTALAGELESVSFDIDNTPPAIVVGSTRADGNRTIVVFDVTDDHSPVQKVEMSQDGQVWRSVFPADGIADSRSEHYEMTVDGPLGPRGVTLRALDAMNNSGTAQVTASAPAAR